MHVGTLMLFEGLPTNGLLYFATHTLSDWYIMVSEMKFCCNVLMKRPRFHNINRIILICLPKYSLEFRVALLFLKAHSSICFCFVKVLFLTLLSDWLDLDFSHKMAEFSYTEM